MLTQEEGLADAGFCCDKHHNVWRQAGDKLHDQPFLELSIQQLVVLHFSCVFLISAGSSIACQVCGIIYRLWLLSINLVMKQVGNSLQQPSWSSTIGRVLHPASPINTLLQRN